MSKEDVMAYEVSSHTSTRKSHTSKHLSVTSCYHSHTIIQSYNYTKSNTYNMNTNIKTKYDDVIITY